MQGQGRALRDRGDGPFRADRLGRPLETAQWAVLSAHAARASGRKPIMMRTSCAAIALALWAAASPVAAQKSGGTLRVYNSSNPPSASIIEEATIATAMAF